MKRFLALAVGLLLSTALATLPSPQALEGISAFDAMHLANR